MWGLQGYLGFLYYDIKSKEKDKKKNTKNC